MLQMQRIDPPEWAPAYARNIITYDDDDGAEAMQAFASHLPSILDALHNQIEMFVNDSDQTFVDEEASFPTQSRLAGTYYLGCQHYTAGISRDQRPYYAVSIQVRCQEKSWIAHQTSFDYLGLEIWITLWRDTGEIVFDPGFNTSVI